MTFPTPHTVGWHTASDAAVDAEGNPATTYTPDLDEAGTQVKVIGWAPAQSTEPELGRVEHDIDLYVPPNVVARPADVVELPSGQFEVVGEPLDWTKGPFGFAPGIVVQLRRVTG